MGTLIRKSGLRMGLMLGICLALCTGASASWDSVALSDSVVTFGVVMTGETTSVQMSITNHLSEPVDIMGVDVTGEVFWTDLTTMEIQPMATEIFNVYFASEQNVNYADFLSVELSGGERSLIAELSAQADHPGTYYSSTQNKWAEDLKNALTDVIDGHTSLGYTPARDQMYGSVDNHGGWVECVYTGRTAFFNTRAGATANNFNCEHTWPQSFFSEDEPMRSDLYQIRPSDMTANTKRANLDFGVVTSVTWSQGGSKLGYDSTSQLVFEPRDVHKGDVARTHFYFIIRYNGGYNGYVSPAKMEAHFRDWHTSDPVDSLEDLRNESIYALQNNRNPFIDHPAFADRISSFFGTAVRVTEPEIAVSPPEIDMGTIGFLYTAHYYFAIVNSGDDSLDVSSIASGNPDFVLSESSIGLDAKAYEYVRVSYTSGSTGTDDSTTISITSDDADESLIEIPVTIHVTDLAGVERDETAPDAFRLSQNSPNPFGERTTISFSLPGASDVSLSVYNTRGQLVARLLSDYEMPPGRHQVVFEKGGLPSGVYYYRLRSAGRVDTKRMVLIN